MEELSTSNVDLVKHSQFLEEEQLNLKVSYIITMQGLLSRWLLFIGRDESPARLLRPIEAGSTKEEAEKIRSSCEGLFVLNIMCFQQHKHLWVLDLGGRRAKRRRGHRASE